jgi:pilin isopeptide linkage protein
MNFTKYKKCAASLGMTFLIFTGIFPLQTFAAEKSTQDENIVNVAFEVVLEFDGDIPDENIPFTFILDEEEGAPLPDVPYVTIDGEGTAEFDEISYTKPGEYEYTIFERDDGIENYIYDSSIYYVDVNVRYDNNGQLIATYDAYTEDAKELQILFINEYSDEQEEESTVPSEITTPPSEATTSYEPTVTTEGTAPTFSTTETTVTQNPTESTKTFVSPTNSSTNTISTEAPKTGDDTNNLPWIVLMFAAAIGIIGCIWYLKATKNRGNGEEK